MSTSANEKAGQSGRKSVKSGVGIFLTAGGATGTLVHRLDATRILPRVMITCDIFIPGPYAVRTKSQLNKQAKHTKFNNFTERLSFAEHWKLVAESSEFHFTLSRVRRAHFFQLEIRTKKQDILSENRESGMTQKSVSLRLKAVVLTPMTCNYPVSDFIMSRGMH